MEVAAASDREQERDISIWIHSEKDVRRLKQWQHTDLIAYVRSNAGQIQHGSLAYAFLF